MSFRSQLPASSLVLMAVILVFATPAAAQILTVETDLAVYVVGAVVQITIHNPTEEPATLVSWPFTFITHEETNACVWGCVGLPVVTEVMPGETLVEHHHTSFLPDPPGTYRVTIAEAGTGLPPLPPSNWTEYELLEPISSEKMAWGGVKSLYR